MRTFSQKPKATDKSGPAESTVKHRQKVSVKTPDSDINHQRLVMHGIQSSEVSHMVKSEGPVSPDTVPNTSKFTQDIHQAPINPKNRPGLQTKLTVNTAGDIYEQEADRVADQVMCMNEPRGHSEPPENKVKNKINTRIPKLKPNAPVQRQEEPEQEGEDEEILLQTKATPGHTPPVFPRVASNIQGIKGGGRPIPADERAFFESRMGKDFSRVRIHTGSKAVEAARTIQARAFTYGNSIVFNKGQYSPYSQEGKRLLAHELTHVVQQQKSADVIQRKPSLIERDIDEITTQVRRAIDRWGTDEEAVYTALQRLERDGDAIKRANAAYSKKYGTTLEKDIRGDFSEEELQYALELIGITPIFKKELIRPVPSHASDYDYYASRLHKAMDIWGTNEEAIYGVLIAMENVPEKIEKLKAAYAKKYPTGIHGGDLEHDIRSEMSEEELDYALLLLNVTPLGNTAILTRIRGSITSLAKNEIATAIMNSLNQLTNDRLTVIMADLKDNKEIANFKKNLLAPVAGQFPALVNRIAVIEANFADPGVGTTAVTSDQKKQITSVLNQGMKVDAKTGKIADFVDKVAGRTYDQDIQETLEREVTHMTPRAIKRSALPKFKWPRYKEMAIEAKERTDAVFGHYVKATKKDPATQTDDSALSSDAGPGRNLFDYSEQAFSNANLLHFANYLVTGHNAYDPIYPKKTIHQVHTADLEDKERKKNLNDAIVRWIVIPGNKARLLKVNQNWSGAQSGGNIYMQRWDVGNVSKNRRQFWKMFQTMIHEYLHKITHKKYSDKAHDLGRAKEQVYTEGGTSYFDERVWKTIYPEEVRANHELREKVEGGVYPYDSSLIPTVKSYEQIDQFKQIVKIVGEANASAAYFLGETDKIGL